jgi:hypothetical protein
MYIAVIGLFSCENSGYTEGVIRIEEEQTTQWPKEKGQTTIYKTYT